MDFETKVKLLKEKYGFEECGDRRMELHIDSKPRSKDAEIKLKKIIDKNSFLVRPNEKGELNHWYSEEYIRNTDIDKILYPFNSKDYNDSEIEWLD